MAFLPTDFKSVVSTNSTTRALLTTYPGIKSDARIHFTIPSNEKNIEILERYP
jgi:hypothetical protein